MWREWFFFFDTRWQFKHFHYILCFILIGWAYARYPKMSAATRYLVSLSLICNFFFDLSISCLIKCLPMWIFLSWINHRNQWVLSDSVPFIGCKSQMLLPPPSSFACLGWAVKRNGLKLWCLWSAECGFESWSWQYIITVLIKPMATDLIVC